MGDKDEKTRFIEPLDIEGKYFLQRIPVIPGDRSEESAENIATLLKRHRGIIVKGHGTFAEGKDLEEAYLVTALIEHSCKIGYYYMLFHMCSVSAETRQLTLAQPLITFDKTFLKFFDKTFLKFFQKRVLPLMIVSDLIGLKTQGYLYQAHGIIIGEVFDNYPEVPSR